MRICRLDTELITRGGSSQYSQLQCLRVALLADMSELNDEDGLEEFNKKKAEFRHKDNDNTIINFYTKVVFPDNDTKKEFYRKANIPANEEYITFDQMKRYFEGSDK